MRTYGRKRKRTSEEWELEFSKDLKKVKKLKENERPKKKNLLAELQKNVRKKPQKRKKIKKKARADEDEDASLEIIDNTKDVNSNSISTSVEDGLNKETNKQGKPAFEVVTCSQRIS